MSPKKREELRFKQIVTGTWQGNDGVLNFSLIGLTESGEVWRLYVRKGWIRLNHKTAAQVADEEVYGPGDGAVDDVVGQKPGEKF